MLLCVLLVIRGVGHRVAFFTINGIMYASHKKVLLQERDGGWSQYVESTKFRVPVMFWM